MKKRMKLKEFFAALPADNWSALGSALRREAADCPVCAVDNALAQDRHLHCFRFSLSWWLSGPRIGLSLTKAKAIAIAADFHRRELATSPRFQIRRRHLVLRDALLKHCGLPPEDA